MGAVRTAVERARLYFWSKRQATSMPLRRHFKRYGIDVGLESYGCFDRWRMPGPLKIGRYCSIAATVRVVPANHPHSAITTHPIMYEAKFGAVERDQIRAAPLIIEDDVWIGHNAILMPGCKFVGRGAIIGAGAIVTHDVGAYEIVAGVPARKIKDRFPPDLVAALEASRWWELTPEGFAAAYKTNREAFTRPTAENLAKLFG